VFASYSFKITKISFNVNSYENSINLIEQNFFIIDSNNLENISSHMYGYSISKKGIITNNYYEKIGRFEEPDPQGVYVLIRKVGNEIILNQDYYGNFGIYIYENRETGYFSLSNSFLLLEEYLIGKYKMNFNKDFADNFIISELCSPSIHETLIKEIIRLVPNAFIIINITTKKIKIGYKKQEDNTVPLESEEGLKIIDNWVNKWAYIFRSLKKKTNNISCDLSGGFDTRIVLSILLNSGIDLNEILIFSTNDKVHVHEEDYKIASKIASAYGFKLNGKKLNNKCIQRDFRESIISSIYTKLGFHKEFYFKSCFFNKPRFSFTGAGGGMLRGYPGIPIDKYIEQISSQGEQIKGYEHKFFNSSIRLLNRSISLLKNKKNNYNDYQLSTALYLYGRGRNHFGKASLESFLANIYILDPLMDPDIKKIKFNSNRNTTHDLIAYIYVRFAYDLITFPIQGKRTLNQESVKKAEELNSKIKFDKKEFDYNENFYIDNERKSPVNLTGKVQDINEYLKRIIKDKEIFNIINKVYNKKVYIWALDHIRKSNYFPLRHGYALLAIAKIIKDLSINKI
jgi:hypothetical protein